MVGARGPAGPRLEERLKEKVIATFFPETESVADTVAILDAARMHHWTHLVIRKDYAHANPLPLQRIFENEDYAVFKFPE